MEGFEHYMECWICSLNGCSLLGNLKEGRCCNCCWFLVESRGYSYITLTSLSDVFFLEDIWKDSVYDQDIKQNTCKSRAMTKWPLIYECTWISPNGFNCNWIWCSFFNRTFLYEVSWFSSLKCWCFWFLRELFHFCMCTSSLKFSMQV